MIYSSQRCPHCKTVLKTETNPSLKIGNPFEKCRYCGEIVVNPYRQEWITIKPMKRSLMKGVRFFNKAELEDAIESSLCRTKVIEYVEQLKQAGFEIYQIEGYKSAIIHDEAVFYSLTNYNYPKDNGIRIDKQNLPQVRDFASNGYDNTVRFLNLIESMGTGKDYLNHNDRVYYAYRAFKIELINALFPEGITFADFIIREFAKIINVKLEKCQCIDYFNILTIYYELICEIILRHNKSEIVSNIMKKFPNVFQKASTVELLLEYFK
ncbi:hypothetical protein II906_11260 [bacterium]|nr:hypothetical protein [bacterium]